MYYTDHRLKLHESDVVRSFQEFNEVELPIIKIVCPTCQGTGSHVNPSIDSGGISSEEFFHDPDFAADYFSGVYDVTCYQCKGKNVVDAIDTNALKHQDQELYQEWLEWLRGEEEFHALCESERRMGA